MVEWRWKWSGKHEKSTSRRTYYQAVTRTDRKNKNLSQTFRVGDTVCMRGEGSETWVAHLLELFQVHEDDEVLRDALSADALRDVRKKDVFMRCTLRWFYGTSDISKAAIASSAFGKSLPGEVYFSDYVERDGFNDVQVLEGLAWLFPSLEELRNFERAPSNSYNEHYDILRIARAFVNNHDDDEPIRKLEKEELSYLVNTPIKDQDMYSKSYLVMTGRHLRQETTRVSPKKKKAQKHSSQSSESEDDSYSAPPSASASSNSSDSDSSELDDRSASATPRASARVVNQRRQGYSDVDRRTSKASIRSHTGRRKVKFTRDERNDGSDYEPEKKDERNAQRRINEERRKKAEARERAESRKNSQKALKKRLFHDRKATKRLEIPNEPTRQEGLSEANQEVLDFVNELNESAQVNPQTTQRGPLEGLAGSSSRKKTRDTTTPRPRPLKPGENHLKKLRTGAAAKEKAATIYIDSDDDDRQEGAKILHDWDGDNAGSDDEDDIPIVASATKQTRSTVEKQGKKASSSNANPVPIRIEKSRPDPTVDPKPLDVQPSSSMKTTPDKHRTVSSAAKTGGSVFMPTARKSDLASKSARSRPERVKKEVPPCDIMDIEPAVAHANEPEQRNESAAAAAARKKIPPIPEDVMAEIQALGRLFENLSTDEQALLRSNSEFLIGVATVKFDEQLSKSRGQLDERAEYCFAKEVSEVLLRESNTKKPGVGH